MEELASMAMGPFYISVFIICMVSFISEFLAIVPEADDKPVAMIQSSMVSMGVVAFLSYGAFLGGGDMPQFVWITLLVTAIAHAVIILLAWMFYLGRKY